MPTARPMLSLLFVWLLAGGMLLYAASWPPVSRTQEARVLETAREMNERPVREWGIPRLNGAVRLRKPPLAYWLSAASFRTLGVGDWRGRLPMTLLAWGTLGVTFLVAQRLFDTRTALLAAGALGGSWLFFKTAMLAETDGPTAAFLAFGVYALLRARDAHRDWPWQHLLAVCLAGAVLSKGPPAVYLAVLAVGLGVVSGDWRPVRRFFTSGAVVTLVVLAVPWFVYVAAHSNEEGQLGTDLLNSAEGGDHHGPPWYYVQLLLQATLPWTAVWGTGLLLAGLRLIRESNEDAHSIPTDAATTVADPRLSSQRARSLRTIYFREPGLVTITLWGLSVIVPLCFWGNKQLQYLLPAMPPTAILVGWTLANVARRASATRAATAVVVVTNAILILLSAGTLPAFLAVRHQGGESLTPGDAAVVTVLFGLAVWAGLQWRRGRPAGVTAGVALGWGVMFVALAWTPFATGGVSRDSAAEVLGEYPAGSRFYFRGSELPVMSWSMRRAVPLHDEPALAAAAADVRTVVLEQQQDDEHEPTPPRGYVRHQTIRQRENILHVYVPAKAE